MCFGWGQLNKGELALKICEIPLPKAKLRGRATAAAQASQSTLPVTFTQTWTYHLPQGEEQFPLTLLGPEIHLGKYHKSCQTEQDY